MNPPAGRTGTAAYRIVNPNANKLLTLGHSLPLPTVVTNYRTPLRLLHCACDALNPALVLLLHTQEAPCSDFCVHCW